MIVTCSLEAKHQVLVWIMKVTGPKNQADFIEGPPKDEIYISFTKISIQV